MSWSVSLATFNLQNLGVDTAPGRLQRLAGFIVEHLQAPAILAVQELAASPHGQATVSGFPSAAALLGAIREAGGPDYRYREVAPLAGADGGQAGLNIRVGFFFDPQRVDFNACGEADPRRAVVIHHARPPRLMPNPGRIEPCHPAFAGDSTRGWQPSRKALTGEFRVAGETLYLINCHLKSMRCRNRREALQARAQRHAQAERIAGFVRSLLCCQDHARVVVLGDLNDGVNSRTLEILKASGLHNTLEALPAGLRHTCSHGNSLQTLDHLLLSPALAASTTRVIHQHRHGLRPPVSDHDPILVTLSTAPARIMRSPPDPSAVAKCQTGADTFTVVAH